MMKRIYGIAVILTSLVVTAAGQDDQARQDELERLAKVQADLTKLAAAQLRVSGAIMGMTVKGEPYSGLEITEHTQVLSDGTRIHTEGQTTVYRDSEGRVRRETPNEITIWDPVANTSYRLDPKTQVAQQLPLGRTASGSGGRGGRAGAEVAVAELQIRLKVLSQELSQNGVDIGGQVPAGPKHELLGQQVIEGVNAEGTRETSTLEAGAIGNDRPIHIVAENWYSKELQTTIKTVHSDPRTGEEVFRLTNLSRVEPAPYLFQVPAGYQITERK
jgi:hypothetical protein